MTDAEEAAVIVKRTPGGLESLPENDRARRPGRPATSNWTAPRICSRA